MCAAIETFAAECDEVTAFADRLLHTYATAVQVFGCTDFMDHVKNTLRNQGEDGAGVVTVRCFSLGNIDYAHRVQSMSHNGNALHWGEYECKILCTIKGLLSACPLFKW